MTPRTTPDVELAVSDLRDALRHAGVTLPSLGLDLVTNVPQCPYPLVSLGNCHPEAAVALAAALRRALAAWEPQCLAWDRGRARLGEVRDTRGTRVWLRPPAGGGTEWEVHAEELRAPSLAEIRQVARW